MMIKNTITLIAIFLLGTTISFAQDLSKYGETEEQQTLCLEALQVQRTYRDQKLPEAYAKWQLAYNVCPCTASERLFSDGTKFLKKEIKKVTEDEAKTKILVDSLFLVYDARMECYPDSKKFPEGENACNIQGRKTLDLMKMGRATEEEGRLQLYDVIVCLGNKSNATYISQYYVLLYKALKAAQKAEDLETEGELRQQLILDYLMLSDICKFNIDNSTDEKVIERFQKAQGNLDEIFIIIAKCDEMIPVLEKIVNEDPENIEFMKKALELMNAKDCTDSEFYLSIAEKVCAFEPGADCLFSIGIAYLKKKDSKTAYDYLVQAADMGAESENAERYLLRAGQVAVSLGKCSTGTSYANKILKINANSGDALLLKGDAAACMTGACDDGRLGRYCAYWVAVDYYARAKSIDSSVTDKANKKISQASQGFPTKEILFDYNVKEGDPFDCGCLGTSTKVRVR